MESAVGIVRRRHPFSVGAEHDALQPHATHLLGTEPLLDRGRLLVRDPEVRAPHPEREEHGTATSTRRIVPTA